MASWMQKAGKTVEYLPLVQADHYFTDQADRTALITAIEIFMTRHSPDTC